MPLRWLLIIGLLLSAPIGRQAGWGDEATSDEAELQGISFELRVQRLLQQLEASARNQRDEAEAALTELGAAVLPLLPEIRPDTSAELKERITRVRKAIERQSATAAMTPSRIQLSGEFPLAEILRQIEQQTGNRVVDFRERFRQQVDQQPVRIDLDNVEFWPAIDQLLDQAGLTTYSYTGEPRTLGVVAAGDSDVQRYGRASYAGVFRIEATEVLGRRPLRDPARASLQVRLEILWEPRIVPVLIRQPFADLEVVDDRGDPIRVASPEGVAEAPVQSTVAGIDLVLPLELPDRSVKTIERLDGQLTVLVPGREETFEFDELPTANNVSIQRGGLEVTLERVRQNGAVYEFRLRLRLLNRADTFQSHLDWSSNNVVYLVNSKGERIENPNFERYLEREREVGYGYLFPVSGDLSDYRLVYRSPAAILTVPVKYSLTKIPLP